MSDMRFVVAGVALAFAALVTFGAFGSVYVDAVTQAEAFEKCRNFGDSGSAARDCDEVLAESTWAIALPIALVCASGFSLVKGARGTWDQDVSEGDMVGAPRGNK